MDDMVQAEVDFVDRCAAASAAGLESHEAVFGVDCVKDEKFTGWVTRGTVLGVDVNTNSLELSLPVDKAEELARMLADYGPARQRATPREVMSVVGKLRCFSLCIRPGRFFLRRLINWVSAAEKETGGGLTCQ
jgi:hypothetical protein